MKPYLQRREQLGAFKCTVQEIRAEDEGDYRNYFRMTSAEFDELLNLIFPKIVKKDTKFR